MGKENFQTLIRQLREAKFPGISLRATCEELKKQGYGENFFTYLSKIESGSSLPSETLLVEIAKAYKLTIQETKDLQASYMVEKLNRSHRSMNDDRELDDSVKKVLFRKLKQ